jgi:multidrug efflux pump subunit AcrB
MGIDDVPVLAVTLWSRNDASALELERVAATMESELKRVPGTREVTTLGGPDQVVRVTLDPERMAAQRITVADIERELRATGAAAPAGQLTSANRVIDVRAGEFFQSAADVERLVLAVRASAAGNERRPVFLADVARVAAGPDTPDRYVWHGEVAETGGERRYSETPAVTIAVSKKAGENAASVADALLARVEQLRGSVLPEDVAVSVTRNYGETANEKANELLFHLGLATVSIVLLVAFAIGWREAVVVAVVAAVAAVIAAAVAARRSRRRCGGGCGGGGRGGGAHLSV